MHLPSQKISLLLLILSCGCGDGSLQEKTFLLSHTGLGVTAYQASLRARSKIDCVRRCRRFSHCTSFVFEKSSGDCYLNPNITSGSGRSLFLYEDLAPTCDPRTMPPLNNNGRVQVWKQTLTELEGDVTCEGDFMEPNSDKITVHCTGDGKWNTKGECAQYIFRSPFPEVGVRDFRIPRPVREGWSLCMEGTPTENTSFAVELTTADDSLVLFSDYRLSFRKDVGITLVRNHRKNQPGQRSRFSKYFPFVAQQPFKLQITLKKKNLFEIKGNGKVIGNFQTVFPPPVETAFVIVRKSVSLQLMNLWCSP